jgi:hypothetical protein
MENLDIVAGLARGGELAREFAHHLSAKQRLY